jgi:isochorismate hydrolase
MIWSYSLAASLLATGAYAGVGRMAGMAPRSMMETRMGDEVTPMLQRRQSSSLNLSPDQSSMNMSQWNSETSAACTSSLSQLSAASNPSGTAVCYNIASLDTNTGAFMADLRLFQVSSATGDFSSIPQQNIQVGLQYTGASVSAVNSSTVTARDLQRRASTPTQLQTYMLVGQIDKAQLAQPMTM